jgi:endonuclease/exonuclease/phosphatase family metal-dependent hydrolase
LLPCCATIDADVVASRKSSAPDPRGTSHIEEIGAQPRAWGWVMAPAREWRGHQFGNAVLSRLPIVITPSTICRGRPARSDACNARRFGRRPPRCTSITSTSAPRILERPLSGPSAWPEIVSDRHVRRREDCARRLYEWDRAAHDAAPQRPVESRRFVQLPEAAADLPGLFPLLHLDHIYYAGRMDIVGIELPRTRLSLVAVQTICRWSRTCRVAS